MADQIAILRILKWEAENAWSDNVTHIRNTLIQLMRKTTAMTHTEAKRFVKKLLDRQVTEFSVRASGPYRAIRHHLEVLGAEVDLQVISQPGAPADVPATASRPQSRD